MNILITNDDGWGAKGIMTLTRLMTKFGHVTVLAPDGPRSGQSNAITVGTPLWLKKLDSPLDMEDAEIYVTNGTPSDCVKLAINTIFKDQYPDLLVSGINHGSNAAINVIYSGTMGACFVAREQQIPSIGFSICDHNPDVDFSHFEPYIEKIVSEFIKSDYLYCLNVNAPVGELKGIRMTRQCDGHWVREFFPEIDEDGNTIYRLTGEFENREPFDDSTDEWALANGYVSITPCTVDTTDYDLLNQMWLAE